MGKIMIPQKSILLVLIKFVCIVFLMGCDECSNNASSWRPEDAKISYTWFGANGDFGSHNYWNTYEYYSRYPNYGIAVYMVCEKDYDPKKEKEWVARSLSICRKSFSTPYQSQKLASHYSSGRKPEKIDLEFVCIVIFNMSDHTSRGKFGPSHKVGYIFKADEVFSDQYDVSKLVENAYVDRNPVDFDGTGSGFIKEYLIIDRYQDMHVRSIRKQDSK